MLNAYIYHHLPPTWFGVCYTIVKETIVLLAQKLYAVFNVAIKCTIGLVCVNLQCCYDIQNNIYFFLLYLKGDRGGTMVKVLCYKSEGRRFNSRWCRWNFLLTKFFRSHYGPGGSTHPLTEMNTRSIFWGWKRPVRKADKLTTIFGHCHVIWEPQLPGTLWAPRACNGTDLPLLYLK